MRVFSRPNLTFSAPENIADEMRPLVAGLVADDADGRAYRSAIRHWLWSERPIIETFAGRRVALQVEGPEMIAGQHRFPMGGVISGICGWRRLGPIETKELLFDLRAEIDVTINRWLFKHALTDVPDFQRPSVDRARDDAEAIASMEAWVRRNSQIEALHASR